MSSYARANNIIYLINKTHPDNSNILLNCRLQFHLVSFLIRMSSPTILIELRPRRSRFNHQRQFLGKSPTRKARAACTFLSDYLSITVETAYSRNRVSLTLGFLSLWGFMSTKQCKQLKYTPDLFALNCRIGIFHRPLYFTYCIFLDTLGFVKLWMMFSIFNIHIWKCPVRIPF